jgi:hypothetical protein
MSRIRAVMSHAPARTSSKTGRLDELLLDGTSDHRVDGDLRQDCAVEQPGVRRRVGLDDPRCPIGELPR